MCFFLFFYINKIFTSASAEMLNYEFDTKNLVSLVVSSAVGVWYLLKKVGGRRLTNCRCVWRRPLLTFMVCDITALDRQ